MVAKGVFRGVGRYAEFPDLPSRVDLVFPGGTGQFGDATGSVSGTVSAQALLARNP
jgi:hypothetical protein